MENSHCLFCNQVPQCRATVKTDYRSSCQIEEHKGTRNLNHKRTNRTMMWELESKSYLFHTTSVDITNLVLGCKLLFFSEKKKICLILKMKMFAFCELF